MLGEELSRALCDISDEKIVKAAAVSAMPRKRAWPRFVAAAAVLVILVGLLFAPGKSAEDWPINIGFALYVYASEEEMVALSTIGQNVNSNISENTLQHHDIFSSSLPGTGVEEKPGFLIVIAAPDDRGSYNLDIRCNGVALDRETYPTISCGYLYKHKGGYIGRGLGGRTETDLSFEILLRDMDGTVLQRDVVSVVVIEGGYVVELLEHYASEQITGYAVQPFDEEDFYEKG